MGDNRPNAEQQRLSKLRALKDQHFPDADPRDEALAEKDRRIADLEREVEVLQLRLSRARKSPEAKAPTRQQQHGVY